MTDRVYVADEGEMQPGDRTILSTDRGDIGVFRVDGGYHAVVNTCIHQGGPLCEGKLHPEIVQEFVGVGERMDEFFTERPVIKCPWHGWEYYLDTGENVADPELSVPTFDVVVEEGEVYLEL